MVLPDLDRFVEFNGVAADFHNVTVVQRRGFVDDNGLRQYNEVLILEARKNGKTSLTAAIELDMLLNDKEGAPQIYNLATMLDQARLGFNAAHKMVKQSPLLSKHIRKRVSDLYFAPNMGFIRALASQSNGLDGLDTHCAVIDELSAIKNRDLYDLIKQSMGARSQPEDRTKFG